MANLNSINVTSVTQAQQQQNPSIAQVNNNVSTINQLNVNQQQNQQTQVDREKIYQWINELTNAETRENALLELSKKREVVPDLAILLWYSFGSITALLQEIITVYPILSPSSLSPHQSNRVCNALALLQCVASHNDTHKQVDQKMRRE
ncbi:hypothetical protein RND71_044025 [Anisodus tanguticus]|uniref:Cell differentiation protein RQCD1 homolog n=1 Tax=Anisodus tanguticus TaxID=243964 RepID=A0AAE1QNZ5_9SOLA|nr:hypothetical protein RND71_044025 [Anisodus tanguticus]